jgi:antitoxin MazE
MYLMGTSIARWGNSLAVRLPKAVIDALGLREGDDVRVTAEHGAVVVRPIPAIDLDAMLSRITPENRPEPHDWVRVGRELL